MKEEREVEITIYEDGVALTFSKEDYAAFIALMKRAKCDIDVNNAQWRKNFVVLVDALSVSVDFLNVSEEVN